MAKISTPNDPLFAREWYLRNTGQAGGGIGIDLNVSSVWPDYTGKGVKLAITDDGVQLDHPDLEAHVDVDRSYDAGTNTIGDGAGSPVGRGDNHGTAVAGIAAAVGNNGLGTTGVAYDATIISYRIPLGGDDAVTQNEVPTDLTATARAFVRQLADGIDVTNNSWGIPTAFANNWDSSVDTERDALIALGTRGRGGLGTNIVFSAGNDRVAGADAMLDNVLNSRFVITVAAVSNNGTASSYSTAGADILVSGFGGGNSPGQSAAVAGNALTTTDRTGLDGYNKINGTEGDYGNNMNGTSAAAPSVSGVVALMLQAAPRLGYRDVQTILAYSARFNDAGSTGWTMTHAGSANGGGLHYSREYGFGLADAHGATRLAEVWAFDHGPSHTEANQATVAGTAAAFNPAPGTAVRPGAPVSIAFDFAQALTANRIEIALNLVDPNPSTLLVKLTSPSGTAVNLVQLPGNTLNNAGLGQATPTAVATPWPSTGFTLDTPAFMGENVAGEWTLTIFDLSAASGPGIGVVYEGAQLGVYGDTPALPSSMVFNDDFATLATRDASRLMIGTAGATSRLNAAAMSSAVTLDLSHAKDSTVQGQTLSLAAGARFDQVFGGDGNDTLVGDGTGQLLYGGRGSDTIDGGTAAAGATAAASTALYLNSRATYAIAASGGTTTVRDNGTDAGTDQVRNVSKIQFLEGTLFAPAATDNGINSAIYYEALLGRAPDESGYRFWSTASAGIDQIGQGFLGSAEYAAGRGKETNTQFVTDLYRDLLGRTADAGGFDFWVSALQSGASRASTALLFGSSAEFTANRMGQLFTTINGVGDVWGA